MLGKLFSMLLVVNSEYRIISSLFIALAYFYCNTLLSNASILSQGHVITDIIVRKSQGKTLQQQYGLRN